AWLGRAARPGMAHGLGVESRMGLAPSRLALDRRRRGGLRRIQFVRLRLPAGPKHDLGWLQLARGLDKLLRPLWVRRSRGERNRHQTANTVLRPIVRDAPGLNAGFC